MNKTSETIVIKFLFQDVLVSSFSGLNDLGLGNDISNIEISLPKHWRQAACQPGRTVLSTRISGAKPNLILQHQGAEPYSLQPRGCGAQGLGVSLPLSALDKPNLANTVMTQLINSRFGVFLQDYESLTQVLNNTNYDGMSRTEQNIICEGRNPLDIIGTRSQPVNFTQPEFRYVVEGEEHYVLVLDQTSIMDINQRWINIKKSFNRFINNLKDGTMLSIITYGREGNLVLPPTVVTHTNREGLHGRIPRRIEESNETCLSCGIKLAKDILAGSSGSIILVTGNLYSNLQVDDITEIYTVLYPAREETNIGTVYSILEKNTENPLNQLNEVLIDIMNRAEEDTLAKIHESDHLSYEFSGTFIVEENLREDITVTLTVEDEQKIEYFEVIDPSGQKNIFSKFEDGMVLLRYSGLSEPGIWTYHVKLYPEAGLPGTRMLVDVVARGKEKEIRIVGIQTLKVDNFSTPVQILARIERGEEPVHGAEIRAIVSGPNSYTEVVLKDTGYSDIKEGDGVYSGYLSVFSSIPGYYTVRILSSDNNGRSFTLSEGAPIPTGSYRRYVAAPSFFVKVGVVPGEDIIPPSRVSDLSLTLLNTSSYLENSELSEPELENSTSLNLELRWTAPGDNYDEGRVDKYEIRCHTNPLALSEENFTSQGILVNQGTTLISLGSGSIQRILTRVPWTNELFYFALTSFDVAGNRGRISNLVQVYVDEDTDSDITEKDEEIKEELKLGKLSWFLDKQQIYIVSGVGGGVLLIIVLLILALILRAKRLKRSKTQWVQDTYEAGFTPETKVERVETESGIYSWLESLPRSESGQKKGFEEGSNSSRPTTSTDDSISDSGEHRQSNEGLMPGTKPFANTPLRGDGMNKEIISGMTRDSLKLKGDEYVTNVISKPSLTISQAQLIERLNGGTMSDRSASSNLSVLPSHPSASHPSSNPHSPSHSSSKPLPPPHPSSHPLPSPHSLSKTLLPPHPSSKPLPPPILPRQIPYLSPYHHLSREEPRQSVRSYSSSRLTVEPLDYANYHEMRKTRHESVV